jgi:hypothetical protein
MKVIPVFVLPFAALALAGCGGGGGGGGGGGSANEGGSPNGGPGVNGISVSNCLIAEDFLVQPSETTIDGSSPNGVNFSLRFYKDEGTAKAAYDKRDAKTTALVENAVVDFKGNPSPYAGAPPAKISQRELTVIRRCIDENKEA